MDSAEFDVHVGRIVNSGLTSLVLCLGNELGLVDCLCHHLTDAATIDEIASFTRLKPRYVQEWLGCMVAADLVHVATTNGVGRYSILEPHRRSILLAAENAAAVQLLARRQEKTRNCFSLSGPHGFGYSDMPEMFEYMSNAARGVVANYCAKDILPAVDNIRDKLEQGCRVADVGCGSGDLLLTLARQFPNSSFTGIDNCPEAITRMQALVTKYQLTNVTAEQANAHSLLKTWDKCFDWVLMNEVLHDLPNPQTALKEILRVLKDDGVFSLLEIGISSSHKKNAGNMTAAGCYAFSIYACLPCSLESEEYENTNPGVGWENMEKLVIDSGFKVAKIKKSEIDSIHIHMVCKKSIQIAQE